MKGKHLYLLIHVLKSDESDFPQERCFFDTPPADVYVEFQLPADSTRPSVYPLLVLLVPEPQSSGMRYETASWLPQYIGDNFTANETQNCPAVLFTAHAASVARPQQRHQQQQ